MSTLMIAQQKLTNVIFYSFRFCSNVLYSKDDVRIGTQLYSLYIHVCCCCYNIQGRRKGGRRGRMTPLFGGNCYTFPIKSVTE